MHYLVAWFCLLASQIAAGWSLTSLPFSPRPPGTPSRRRRLRPSLLGAAAENNNDDTPESYHRKADELREQIRAMEEKLGPNRKRNYSNEGEQPGIPSSTLPESSIPSLAGKRVLVTGANGRLGSMVCRHLLRNYPQCQVVAQVHTISENSPTSRGYARLSYEVGAEDGVGQINPVWQANNDDDTAAAATFSWTEDMREYNLQKLRLVECELLDPVQCASVAESCDAMIWCATDFNGNTPRALGLNVAFLFRAVADPTKGRVEVEGLQNMLGALKEARQDKARKLGRKLLPNDPTNVVLVSVARDAYEDFETPFGTFYNQKQQGEAMLRDFPSLTHAVLQMGVYDDNFVEADMYVYRDNEAKEQRSIDAKEYTQRAINRRDAAQTAVEALLDDSIRGETVQVYTAVR